MNAKRNLLTLAGAAVGGTLGYFLFFWLLRQGLLGLVLPGGLLGFGAGFFKPSSVWVAIVCGLSALVLGLVCRWQAGTHDGFVEFLQTVPQLPPVTLLMIAVGAFIGFWLPFRSRQRPNAP